MLSEIPNTLFQLVLQMQTPYLFFYEDMCDQTSFIEILSPWNHFSVTANVNGNCVVL